MGANNSSNRPEEDEYDNNCNIPVMGEGYDPIYDSALIGDWTTMIQLCKTSVIVDETETSEKDRGNGSITEDENNNGTNTSQTIKKKMRRVVRKKMNWAYQYCPHQDENGLNH